MTGPRGEVRRRHRVQPQPSRGPGAAPGRQRQQPPPQEREEQAHLGAQRARRAHELPHAAQPQARERRQRGVGAREALQRAALGARHPVAAAHLEHGRELLQPAVVHVEVHPPPPHPLTRVVAQLRHPLTHLGAAIGRGVPQHGRAVLGVVVQRAVHELDLPECERRERDPVVVEVGELGGRERQRVLEHLAPQQGGGAGDRVRHQQGLDVVVVGAPQRPVGVRQQLPVRRHQPGVAVRQLGAADLVQQGGQLVRVPDVVLVGHRHEGRLRRGHRQRSLEVRVEPEPAGRARDHEPRIARQLGLELAEAPGRRAVVAHHAHPVAVALRADRLDLAAEQLHRRLVRGHADRHQRSRARLGRAHGSAVRQLVGLQLIERGRGAGAVAQARPQAQPADGAVGPGRYPHRSPEAAAVAVARRVLGSAAHGLEQIQPRHPVLVDRLGLAVERELQRLDRRARGEARPADEDGGAHAHAEPAGQRRVQAHVEVGRHQPGRLRSLR